MAFWGVEVKPGMPFTLKATGETGVRRRLHISQATLGGLANETARHILVCNVGNRPPLYLCILSAGKVDSCNLNLDFEEADEVIFSVIGPFSIHITGYEDKREIKPSSDVEIKPSSDVLVLPSQRNDDGDATTQVKKKRRRDTREETTDVERKPSSDVEIKPSSDVLVLPSQRNDDGDATTQVKKKRRRDTREETTDVSTKLFERSENKEIKPTCDVLPSHQNDDDDETTRSRKMGRRDNREETTNVSTNLFESAENKKQATDKTVKKKAETKKPPPEPEISSTDVHIEEIEKGNSGGKSAVKGKKISIHYTGMLKDPEKVFVSNLGEAPLRFLIGGKKVIKGLSIGVEGMRVGDKRRLTIPPSLGYSEEGLNEDVPKNAWLIYDVEAVKVR